MEGVEVPESTPEQGAPVTGGDAKELASQSMESDDVNNGMWPEYCNPSYRMPDEIEVKVKLAAGDYYFPVMITKSTSRKNYLGGYRNKLSGSIYHHASTQTPTEAKRAVKDVSQLRCRETQTYEERSLSVQPYRESGTQMERQDLVLDNKRDYVLESRTYFTSEQLLEKKRLSSVFIQRCWRGYMARCRAHAARQSNIEYELEQQAEKQRREEEEKLKRDKDMHRRLHPKTNEDFAILYNELDSWRREEVVKIKSSTSPGEERNQAMQALLLDETKSLQNIQRLKVLARKSTHKQNTNTMLTNMSKPHQWQLSSGGTAHVQTPAIQRAKELLDLYNALNSSFTSIEERLDCLLHIKWTVLEFDAPLTKDIADLTDREADLLNRGRPIKSMDKLRTRLSNLFLEFMEEAKYNPRAADFVGRMQQEV